MPQVGIVIGIDGLGKTPLLNLVEQVAKDQGVAVERRRLVDNPHELKEGEAIQRAFREIESWGAGGENQPRLLLYDRFPYPDEWVYGPLMGRKETVWDLSFTFRRMDELLMEHGAKFLYISPPPSPIGASPVESYLHAVQEADEYVDNRDPDVVRHILDSYEFFLEYTQCQHARLYYRQFDEFIARTVLAWFLKGESTSVEPPLLT